jgi:D-aminopeptidase
MRVRQLGVEVGVLPPGPLNAITDVEGVLVGHSTVVEGDSIRTGVTAIRPHPGDVFLKKVPAAIYVANGFGKLTGITQVDELGTLETPVVLTNTLAVGRVADALVRWTLDTTDDPAVRSVNPVIGETNDGFLNAIRVPRIGSAEVESALAAAGAGPVAEGSVGAGTGTRALGFKGGIGTASRQCSRTSGVHSRLKAYRSVSGLAPPISFGGGCQPIHRLSGAIQALIPLGTA